MRMKTKMRFQKMMAAVVMQAFLTAFMLVVPIAAEESVLSEHEPVQMNNIVLFAQHDPLSESNFMKDRTESMVTMCNDTDTVHSLAGYVDAISYGKLQVSSYFPQMENGVIIPYVLSSGKTAYQNCEQIAIEILQNVEIPADIPLDGNSDSIVDNITFVIDGKADNDSSPISPKKFTVANMELNGLRTGSANILNSARLFEDTITGSEGVLCHEFLHSLGYPDLYRSGRTGNPVGMWDIMASNSVFLQYPLAYERAAISGWLESADIRESGTYTLSPASSDRGNRLYLLKTPLSDTEFFALEYRKQGTPFSDEMDTKIYGTGLVVYRVNTEQDGNFKGDQDEIYVFRPGETALDAGEGDIFSSAYGGTDAPDSIGSLDWSAGIADGALVYSNGTNSGICISDIVMDEESLTFTVAFADTSDAKLWESINSDSLGAYLPYEMAASPDGTVYMITSDSKNAVLYRIDDDRLTPTGKPLGSGNDKDMNEPKLAFCGNTPYVLYRDKDYLLHLCRYDYSSESWTEVYQGTALAQYADLTADENKVYVTYTTGSFPYALWAACYDCHTEAITILGENMAENACNMSMAVLHGDPIIAYRDISDGNKAKLAIFQNDSWKTETISESACGKVSMASASKIAWIAPSGSGNSVYMFSGEQMTSYPLPDAVSENAFVQMPILADGQCYLAVNTQNPDQLAVYTLNGTDWEMTGNTLAMDVVNSLSLEYGRQTIYCSYFTTAGTAIIKRLQLGDAETIAGDVNSDGKLDLADVVLLQKWLLGMPDAVLADWKACDLYEDHRLNAWDLCRMKQMIVPPQ